MDVVKRKIATLIFYNPFENNSESIIKDVDISQFNTISDVAQFYFNGLEADCFSIDGNMVEKYSSIPDGDFHRIAMWKLPKGLEGAVFFTIALIVNVVLAAAFVAAAMQIAKYFSVKNKKQRYSKQNEDVSDTQYGWDYNSENSITEGAPIPILYGTRAVIPPVIQRHLYNVSNTEIIEQIYAVCQGGGGFNDVIQYDPDSEGYIQAQFGHASWRNYVDRSTAENYDNYSINRALNMPAYIDFDMINEEFEYETSYITDGKIISDNSYIILPQSIAIMPSSNVLRGAKIELFSESKENYSNGLRKWKRGVVGFTAWGKRIDSQWEQIGTTTTSSRYRTGYIKTTFDATSSDTNYTMYLINNFTLEGTHGYDNYENGNISEIKLYGKIYAGSVVVSNKISIGVTSGNLNENVPDILTSGVWGSIDVEKNIDNQDFIVRTTPSSYPDKIAINLSFPYGLYQIDDNSSDLQTNSVRVIAQYRPHGSNQWINFTGFSNSGKTISGSSSNKKNLYYEEDVSSLNAESYDINVRFTQSYISTEKKQNDLVLDGIEEGWNDNIKYVKTATALVKLRANATMYGTIPQFKITVSRPYVNVYDTISEEWCYADANNPAWVAYDLIVRAQFDDSGLLSEMNDSTLLRELYSHKKIIFSDFVKWARFCNKKNITMSMYYDGTTTIKDALKYVFEIGRASMIVRGNMIGIFIDGEASTVDANGYPTGCFIFNDTNIVAKSWKISYADKSENPTRITLTYFDKTRDWNRYSVIASKQDFESQNIEQNNSDVTLYTCDDMSVAENHAQYLLRASLLRRMFSWKGDIDSMALDIGDNVKVYDDYVTIISISVDEDGYREYSGVEYVPERFPSSENVSGEVGDGLHYLS